MDKSAEWAAISDHAAFEIGPCAAKVRRRGRGVGLSAMLVIAIGGLVLTSDGPAAADGSDAQRALATDEFDRGVRWMDEGRCDAKPVGDKELCTKARAAFQRAFAVYPEGLGALRNLATVERALGLWASAARSYRELARRAPLDPKPARRGWAEIALRELAQIENLAPRLVINVPEPAPPNTRVTLDGVEIPPAVWRVPVEVDPGDHQLVVSADDRESFELAVTVSTSELRAVRVDLVAKVEAKVEVAPPAKPAEPPALTTSVAEPLAPIAPSTLGPPHHESHRWVPLAVAAVGAVGLGVGLGFGYATIDKKQSACGSDRACDPQGYSQARTLGDISTAVTISSATVLTAGLIWYLFDRPPSIRTESVQGSGAGAPYRHGGVSRTSAAPLLGPDRVGLSIAGAF